MQQLLLWKTNKYYIFCEHVCSRRYPACNAHALYRLVCPVWFYKIVPHYATQARFFFKKGTEYEIFVLIFSAIFVVNISHSKEN